MEGSNLLYSDVVIIKLDFGRGLIFKTEQPKTKVMHDIETMHYHYVWEFWGSPWIHPSTVFA